jgi:phage host-nuclease inhibitor protein Gam
MMPKARTKTAAVTVDVPQSREAVADAIAAIGRSQRERARIEANMGDAITRIRAEFERQAEPHRLEIERLQKGVHIWCEARRGDLTDGGKNKTHAFATGEVRWRVTPPSVALKGVEAVLKKLREMKLFDLIRTKEEVNKEAILAAPDAVKGIAGITIEQHEEFVIVPHGAELEDVA